MKESEFFWLVGIMEGEGCFSLRNGHYPIMQLSMADKDIVERARKLFGLSSDRLRIRKPSGISKQNLYFINLFGRKAIYWMKLFMPHLGERRSGRAKEIIKAWEEFDILAGRRRGIAKLDMDKAREIRRFSKEGMSNPKIARKFDVSVSTIWAVIHEITWKERAGFLNPLH